MRQWGTDALAEARIDAEHISSKVTEQAVCLLALRFSPKQWPAPPANSAC